MTDRLKPCPFCGSKHVYWNNSGWIECYDCHIFFQVAFSNADKEENIDWWNTRVEQRMGEWVSDEKGYFHCSECGRKPHDQSATTNFCPNCGARMIE